MKAILIIGVLVFAILAISIPFLLFQTDDGQSEINNTNNEPPTPTSYTLQPANIIGWTAYWDEDNTLNRLNEIISSLSSFSPILYHITETGHLEALSVQQKDTIITLAENNNLPIFPVIGDDFDYERVETLLYEEEIQEQFIEELITTAREEGYDGWDIDIETLEEKDRDAFTSFVENVAENLHENDLQLNMILYAKDEDETYPPALAQDYEAIGSAANQVRLMTYGYHNESTDSGGQAPLDWYRSVLSYASNLIPNEKIVLGLTTHGYDWGGDEVEALTYPQILERIEMHNADVSYNEDVSSAIATYRTNNESHEIWYEDAETITEKMAIAQNEFGINKFAFWRIGAEDEGLWDKIESL